MEWLQIPFALFIIWLGYKFVLYLINKGKRLKEQKILDLAKQISENLDYVFEYRKDEIKELEEWWRLVAPRREALKKAARGEYLLSKYGSI